MGVDDKRLADIRFRMDMLDAAGHEDDDIPGAASARRLAYVEDVGLLLKTAEQYDMAMTARRTEQRNSPEAPEADETE